MLDFEANVKATWDLFYEPGAVVEIRAFTAAPIKWSDGKWTAIFSGYFDDYDAFLKGVRALEKTQKTQGIYVTLNPAKPDLLARAANRIIGADKKSPTTSDKDIKERRWILVDFDPKRSSGISSTDAELAAARAKRDQVATWLQSRGFPDMARATSGNGAHLLIRVDLVNDDQALQLVNDFLAGINRYCEAGAGDVPVAVDSTVSNAARITKLYGTTVRKGDSIPERPHRDSGFDYIPATIEVAPVELLRAVADEYLARKLPAPAPTTRTGKATAPNWADTAEGVEAWLQGHGVSLGDRESYNGNGFTYKWDVDCLTSTEHNDGAVIMWGEGKGLGYKCHHDSCKGKGWADVRAIIDPARPAAGAGDPDGFSADHSEVDADEAHHASYPYLVRNGRLTLLQEVKGEIDHVAIADFTAAITATIVEENGNQTFVISGVGVRGGPFTVEIAALDYGNTAKLKAALESVNAYDSVAVRMSDHLGPAIKKLTTATDTARRFNHTGWIDGKFHLPGRTLPGVTVNLPKVLPYQAVEVTDQGAATNALALLMESMPAAFAPVMLSAVLGPPLATLAGLGNHRYGTILKGQTGTYKTGTLQAFMAMWGAGFLSKDNLIGWGAKSTANAATHLATSATHLPFGIDNYKSNTGDGEKGFIQTMHALLEGSDRLRMAGKEDKLRHIREIQSWPVCTGEDMPESDPATTARFLVIPMRKQLKGIPNGIKANSAKHLPQVAPMWLDWLESTAGAGVAAGLEDQFYQVQDEWRRHLLDCNAGMPNMDRVASTLAVNQVCFMAATKHPIFGHVLAPYVTHHKEGLREIARSMASDTASGLEAQRFVSAVRELLSTGRAILVRSGEYHDKLFPSDRDRVIGWDDGEGGAYLYPGVARMMVEKIMSVRLGEMSDAAIGNQLMELNWLGSYDKGRTLKTRKLHGKPVKMLHVNARGLQLFDDELGASNDLAPLANGRPRAADPEMAPEMQEYLAIIAAAKL